MNAISLVRTNPNQFIEREDEALQAHSAPSPVERGIVDLLIAFHAGAQRSDDDRVRGLQLYAEACADVPASVASFALRRLRFKNPRNPFPPTPQDVFEACDTVFSRWRERVVQHYVEGERWEAASMMEMLHHDIMPAGAPPKEPGCFVEWNLIISMLRNYLSTEGGQKRATKMPLARFEALPLEAFDDGARDAIIELRREEAEADARAEELRRRRREYIDFVEAQTREWRDCAADIQEIYEPSASRSQEAGVKLLESMTTTSGGDIVVLRRYAHRTRREIRSPFSPLFRWLRRDQRRNGRGASPGGSKR